MRGFTRNRLCRCAVSGLVMVLGTGALVLGPISTARAAGADHWIAGTYQAYGVGNGPGVVTGPMVLYTNHSVAVSGTNGSWSVPRKHKRTIAISYSFPAPLDYCMMGGIITAPCVITVEASGLKTPEGIGSRAAPGYSEAFVGDVTIGLNTFWAVRTGPLHSRT